MKKKKTLIILCLIVMILAGGSALYNNRVSNIDSNNYLSTKNESRRSFYYHGNEKSTKDSISFDFKKFDGKWSLMQFTSSKDNKVTITDTTKISKGKFYIVVLDSDYNIIAKKNELNQNGNIDFTTPKDGKYNVRIVGASASGKLNIKASASNNLDISHIDFFN